MKLKSRGLVIFISANLVVALAIAFGGRIVAGVSAYYDSPDPNSSVSTSSASQCR